MSVFDVIRRPELTIYDDKPLPQLRGDGAIRGRQVALWRPPVMLDAAGRTLPGVSKDLIAHYLVHTTSALARNNLGPVTVEWKSQQDRFAVVTLTIQAWGSTIDCMHPIAIISQQLQNALEHYYAGMTLKVRELHKGHQAYDQANGMIGRAMREVEKLRDGIRPHFNDAEYLYIMGSLGQALTLSALIPVSEGGAEQAINTRVSV